MGDGFLRSVFLVQALYFVVTGIWPIVSIKTFEAVTGPKIDRWLVWTLATLIIMVGITIGMAGYRGNLSTEIFFLAVSSAVGLAVCDFIFVGKQRISKIYLIDGAAELAIVLFLFVARYSG